MEDVTKLYGERKRIYDQMKDLHTRAEKEKRSLTADEVVSYERMDADFNELTKRISQSERLAEMGRTIETDHIPAPPDPVRMTMQQPEAIRSTGSKEYADAFWRIVRAKKDDPISTADLKVLMKRGTDTQVTTSDALGGYLVPEQWANDLILTMSYYGGILDAARLMTTASGSTMNHPRLKYPGGGSAAVQKGARITETTADGVADMTFENVQTDAYVYTSKLILASWEELQDEAYDLGGVIRNVAAERIGRIVNEECTTGDGSSKPNGIVTASALGKTASSPTAIGAEELVDLEHSVNSAYRKMKNKDNVGFMFNDSTLAAIKKLSFGSTDDRPLWLPSYREGEPDRILGYKYWINDDMASIATGNKSVLFGNFSKYSVRRSRDVEFVVLREKYADQRCNGYFAYARFDGELMDAFAVKHLIQP